MKKRIETLKAEVLDLQKRSIQYNILKREVDTNRTLYEGLLQRQKEVDVAGGVGANNVFIVDKAEIPGGAVLAEHVARADALAWLMGWAPASPPPTCSSSSTTRCARPRRSSGSTGLATLGVIPKVATGQSRRRGARRSALGPVGSLSLAVHGAAVHHRERAAARRWSSPAPRRRKASRSPRSRSRGTSRRWG